MKKILYLIAVVAMTSFLLSCGSEEFMDVDIHDPNVFFEPKPDAQDEESQIRRNFKNQYGAYLLFNDTLQKEFLGFDINGDSVFKIECVSLDYTIGQTAYASDNYTYLYLKTLDEKKEAVAFLEQNILNHITDQLMPYSWMLCQQINYDDGKQHPYAAAGQRCVVVATGLLSRLKTETQRSQYVSRILLSILGTLTTNKTEVAFQDFIEISKGYYGLTISGSSDSVLRDYARQYGFLEKITSLLNTRTPTVEEDLGMFCTYLLTYDDTYVETTFKDYPLVLKKWAVFKEAIFKLGFRL